MPGRLLVDDDVMDWETPNADVEATDTEDLAVGVVDIMLNAGLLFSLSTEAELNLSEGP